MGREFRRGHLRSIAGESFMKQVTISIKVKEIQSNCKSYRARGIEGKMKGEMYKEVLDLNVISSAKKEEKISKEDNDPKHSTKIT